VPNTYQKIAECLANYRKLQEKLNEICATTTPSFCVAAKVQRDGSGRRSTRLYQTGAIIAGVIIADIVESCLAAGDSRLIQRADHRSSRMVAFQDVHERGKPPRTCSVKEQRPLVSVGVA
jgi:hypothetical protein